MIGLCCVFLFYNMKNSALVVIDLQNDITKNYKEIIAKVNEAID